MRTRTADALSWIYPWRRLIDPRIVWLGIAPIARGFAIAFWAISLSRLEGTELNPTSETNKSLMIRGPCRFTRNLNVFGAYRPHARSCIRSGVATDVRSSAAPVHDGELGASPIRGGGNAPTIQRRVCHAYKAGPSLELSGVRPGSASRSVWSAVRSSARHNQIVRRPSICLPKLNVRPLTSPVTRT